MGQRPAIDGRAQSTAGSARQSSLLARLVGEGQRGRMRSYAFHSEQFIRSTTPRKLANLAAVKVQHRLRRERVLGMPVNYFIDPINVCNLRCPLCPTGRGVLARPPGSMPLADLKRVVSEVAPYAYWIELYNWGEPLLHPDIYEMIRFVRQQGVSVGLSSNLNRLDAQMARQLVESGLSRLVVSIDGITQESYATYRRRGQLDKVLDNLRLLLDTRAGLRSRTPFIVWRMLVGRHNEHEIRAVEQAAHEMGADNFVTGALFVDTRDPQQVQEWLPVDRTYSPYGPGDQEPRNRWDCDDLWQNMVINWDGGVAPCCWLHDPQHDFANISDQTVREIWNGPHYLSARRAIGHRRGQPDDVQTICHRCGGQPSYMEY